MPEIELDLIVPSHTRYLAMIGTIGEQLASAIDRYSGDREVLAYDLNLALTEAVVNAIQHARPTGPDPKVRVHIELADEDLRITVWDAGHGFDLEALPPPNLTAMLECGRGLFLIRSLMDSVSSYDTGNGHILEMKKRLRDCPEATDDRLRRTD